MSCERTIWKRTIKAALAAGAMLALAHRGAFAADLGPEMPIKAQPMPPFTWSGCYAGVQAGGAFGHTGLTDSAGLLAPFTGFTSAGVNIDGYMLGGEIGCDYQFASNWVIGIEGGAAGSNMAGSTSFGVPAVAPGDTATFKATTDLLTTATARVGYAWDRWLLYAKGGGAWAGNKYSAFDSFTTYDYEGLETRFGWTAGLGVEWAFWDNWSLKVEYNYYGFGTRSINFIDNVTGNVGPLNINQNIQVVKLGVNFHVFAGAAPIVPLDW